MGMKHCPKCDILTMPNRTFCFLCGTKLEDMPEDPDCVNCGASVSELHKFCTGCGLPREEALKPKESEGVSQPRPNISLPPPGAPKSTFEDYKRLQGGDKKDPQDK